MKRVECWSALNCMCTIFSFLTLTFRSLCRDEMVNDRSVQVCVCLYIFDFLIFFFYYIQLSSTQYIICFVAVLNDSLVACNTDCSS